MNWQEGQLIYNGKYRIEKYLGGGGFAVTYQAMHTKLNRRVVIKTPNISVQRDPDYPKYVERFKKEAQMLAMCCADSHPHIVQVFDFFEEDGRYCLEMQYIAGKSLWEYVQTHGALPETDAVKYIRQIGLALVDVHKKGVFHLDVTPPNIMLNFDPEIANSGKAVLIDFGIAGDISPPSTLSRSFGNKAFAPYELVRKGSRHSTVDVYCIAASLYYAVTGQRPTNSFDRKYEQEELVQPKQLIPSLSDAVNQGILQGMALEAKDRPQTMQEWLNLLPSLQAGTGFAEIESNSTELILASDVGVDYHKLENLLKAGQWKAADEETTRLMLKIAGREQQGWLDIEDINKFPCTDLRTIDQIWVRCSNGHFGFSVQKRIWQEVGGKRFANINIYITFCQYVGWYKDPEGWLMYEQITFNTKSPEGHLPASLLIWLWQRYDSRFSSGKTIAWWDIITSLSLRLTKCKL